MWFGRYGITWALYLLGDLAGSARWLNSPLEGGLRGFGGCVGSVFRLNEERGDGTKETRWGCHSSTIVTCLTEHALFD